MSSGKTLTLYFITHDSSNFAKIGVTLTADSLAKRYGSGWTVRHLVTCSKAEILLLEFFALQFVIKRSKKSLTKSQMRKGYTETFNTSFALSNRYIIKTINKLHRFVHKV